MAHDDAHQAKHAQGGSDELPASDIDNDSTAAGSTIKDALEALDSAITAEDIWDRSSGLIFPKVLTDLMGLGTNTPSALLDIVGPQPASVGTTPGDAATESLEITGGAGGDTSIVTTGVGGIGSGVSWTGGAGGEAAAALTASTGGAGGSQSITAGAGGNADVSGSGTNIGGAGGDLTLNPGAGGTASLGGSNTDGVSGDVLLASLGGNVGIGTTTPTGLLDVNGFLVVSDGLIDISGSSFPFRTLLMGTTPAGGLAWRDDKARLEFFNPGNVVMIEKSSGGQGLLSLYDAGGGDSEDQQHQISNDGTALKIDHLTSGGTPTTTTILKISDGLLDMSGMASDTVIRQNHFAQNAQPALSANGDMVLWEDTDDSNRTFIIVRTNNGDKKVELT